MLSLEELKKEDDLLYMGKKRIWNGIHFVEQGKYSLYQRMNKTDFLLNEYEVFLNRYLHIRMTPDRKKIQIYKYRRKRLFYSAPILGASCQLFKCSKCRHSS